VAGAPRPLCHDLRDGWSPRSVTGAATRCPASGWRWCSQLSFTPSLLPRPAAFQGFVAGIDGVMGYGLGVVLAKGGEPEPGNQVAVVMPLAGVGALVLGGVALSVLIWASRDTQS
jgi:uncharacterized membrane protein